MTPTTPSRAARSEAGVEYDRRYAADRRARLGHAKRTRVEQERDTLQQRARRYRARRGLTLPALNHGYRLIGGVLPPSNREEQVVAELLVHGVYAEAGACLGIAEATAKRHLGAIMERLGVDRAVQVPLALGWTVIPRRHRRHHEVMAPLAGVAAP